MSQLSSENITVVQLKSNLNKDKYIDVESVCMLYDFQELLISKKIKELVAYTKKRKLELLLGCNANSHHIKQRNSFHKFIIGTGLTILNRESEPIFVDYRRQKVIDIIICMQKIADLVRENIWRALGFRPQTDTGCSHS